MKKALVTGASGFIGANLVRRLLADGHRVHVLLRPTAAMWRLNQVVDDVVIHWCDLTNDAQLQNTIAAARPDWIFHLAAFGNYSWQTDWQTILHTNILATAQLLEACSKQGFEAFINAGSSSEYGLKDCPPQESALPDPNSYYAVTKVSATMLCRYLALSRRLPIITLRLYSVYGPFEDERRLLPTLVAYGLQKRYPPLVNPEVARDFVYVDDASEALVSAAIQAGRFSGEVFNVGSGIQLSMREAVEQVRQLFSIEEQPKWGSMDNRVWDTAVWIADPKKAATMLGWFPGTDFAAGLKKTTEWFQANTALCAPDGPYHQLWERAARIVG